MSAGGGQLRAVLRQKLEEVGFTFHYGDVIDDAPAPLLSAVGKWWFVFAREGWSSYETGEYHDTLNAALLEAVAKCITDAIVEWDMSIELNHVPDCDHEGLWVPAMGTRGRCSGCGEER